MRKPGGTTGGGAPREMALDALQRRLAASAPAIVASLIGAAIVADVGVRLAPLVRRTPPAAVRVVPGPRIGPIPSVASLAGLFGRAPSGAVAEATEATVALVLAGVIATHDPHYGFGIIGPDATHTGLYAVDRTLPGGAALREVYPDRVLIERNGAREWLRLPRQLLGGRTDGAAAVAATGQPRLKHMPPPEREVPPALRPREGNAGIAQVWANQLYANPRRDGDRVAGLELMPSPRLRRAYGLRPGDVLTAINGSPVTDAQQLPDLLASGVGGKATLTILRNGAPEAVVVTPSY